MPRAWYEGSAQVSHLSKVLYNIVTGQAPHTGIVPGANDNVTVDGTASNTVPWRRLSDANNVAGLPEARTRTVMTRRGMMGFRKQAGNMSATMPQAKGRFLVSGELDFTAFLSYDPKAMNNGEYTGKTSMQAGDIKSVVLEVQVRNDALNAVAGDQLTLAYRWLFVCADGILRQIRDVGPFPSYNDGWVFFTANVDAPYTDASLFGLSITPILESRLDTVPLLVADNAWNQAFPSNLYCYMPFKNTAEGKKPSDWLPWSAAAKLDGADGNPTHPATLTIDGTTYTKDVDYRIGTNLSDASYTGARTILGGFSPEYVVWLTAGPALGAQYTGTFDTETLSVEMRPMGSAQSNKLQLPIFTYLAYEKTNPWRAGGVGFYTHNQGTYPWKGTQYDPNKVIGTMVLYTDANQVNDDSPVFYRVLVTESFVVMCLIGDPGTSGQSAFGFFGKYVPNAPDVDLYPYCHHFGEWGNFYNSPRTIHIQQSVALGWKYFDQFHQFGVLPSTAADDAPDDATGNYSWYEAYFEQLPLANGENTQTRIDKRWQLANWLIRDGDGGGYRGALPHVFRTPGVGWSSGDFFTVNEGQPTEERYFLYAPTVAWPKVAIRYK